jgi:hypothetical protein
MLPSSGRKVATSARRYTIVALAAGAVVLHLDQLPMRDDYGDLDRAALLARAGCDPPCGVISIARRLDGKYDVIVRCGCTPREAHFGPVVAPPFAGGM